MEKHEKPVWHIEYKKKIDRCVVETFLPPLNKTEEVECLKRIREEDKSAKEKLILHNMRLVAHTIKKYVNSEEDAEELISIGTIGLIKAVDSFKMDYGNKFSTYAIRCIENEILMHFRSKKKTRQDISLYEPIGTDKEGNQIQLMDVIENSGQTIEECVQEKGDIDKLINNIKEILDDREYYIISRRYCINNESEMTQREIAKEINISRSYVSRIEKRALEKLKNFLCE